MKASLRNPDRTVEISGPKRVVDLLAALDILPEAVLVIRDATLMTRDEELDDSDAIEVRPVLSGGAEGPPPNKRRDCGESAASEGKDDERGVPEVRRVEEDAASGVDGRWNRPSYSVEGP
ncbi:MAG: MoaD/ThiS family protein [Actinomycetota bacterium]